MSYCWLLATPGFISGGKRSIPTINPTRRRRRRRRSSWGARGNTDPPREKGVRDLVLAPSLPLLSFFPSPPIIFHLLPARLLPPRGVNTDHLLCLSRLTLSLTPRSRTRREMEMESKNGGKVVRERHRRGRPVRLPYFFSFFFFSLQNHWPKYPSLLTLSSEAIEKKFV